MDDRRRRSAVTTEPGLQAGSSPSASSGEIARSPSLLARPGERLTTRVLDLQTVGGAGGNVAQRAVVLVEDDAGDALLVEVMLQDVAPDVAADVLLDAPGGARATGRRRSTASCSTSACRTRWASRRWRSCARSVPDVPVVVLTGRVDDGIGPRGAGGRCAGLPRQGPGRRGGARAVPALRRRARACHDVPAGARRGGAAGAGERPPAARAAAQPADARRPSSGAGAVLPTGQRAGAARRRLLRRGADPDRGVHLLIGDVSGHGPDEAALGVALRIAWRALVLAGLPRGRRRCAASSGSCSPNGATTSASPRSPWSRSSPDLTRAELLLCGHPAPLLVRGRRGRRARRRAAAGPDPAAARRVEPVAVELGGDWGLLLFTDGLVEGSSRPGRERPPRRRPRSAGHLQSLVDRRAGARRRGAGAARRGGAPARRAADRRRRRRCSSAASGWWSLSGAAGWTLARRLRVALGALSLLLAAGRARRWWSCCARPTRRCPSRRGRTFPARLAASQLLTSLVDQETGLRGYALSRDPPLPRAVPPGAGRRAGAPRGAGAPTSVPRTRPASTC